MDKIDKAVLVIIGLSVITMTGLLSIAIYNRQFGVAIIASCSVVLGSLIWAKVYFTSKKY